MQIPTDRTENLGRFLAKIGAFQKIKVIDAGKAYHYSPHGALIRAAGTFKGVPVGTWLVATQAGPASPPANDPNGVVFAYPSIQAAVDEGRGPGMEVFELQFRRAVSAIHLNDNANRLAAGLSGGPQFLVIASEIVSFESLGMVEDFYRARETRRSLNSTD